MQGVLHEQDSPMEECGCEDRILVAEPHELAVVLDPILPAGAGCKKKIQRDAAITSTLN